jgi:hypothetical protein
MNNNNQQTELSYYGLYLLKYLQESHPDKSTDSAFIQERADQAAAVFEQARLEDYSPDGAQELAMATLLEGLHFSPYNTLVEILWNEFEDEVEPSNAPALAFKLLSTFADIISSYTISDDFAQSPEYDTLYTELTGAIVTYFEQNGI